MQVRATASRLSAAMRDKLLTFRAPRAWTTSSECVLGAKRGAAWLWVLLNESGIYRFQTACLEISWACA